MVSKQTKMRQQKSVPLPSLKAVNVKKIKTKDVRDNKAKLRLRPKSQRGQIKDAQFQKNQKQDGSVNKNIQELIEAAAGEEVGKVQRMTRKKTKEGLQMRPAPGPPAKSRMRKQVPATVNSAAAIEKPEKVQRMTRKKTKEGLQMRPTPAQAKSRMRKQIPSEKEKPEKVQRVARKKSKEVLELKPSPSPANSRNRKRVLEKFNQDKEIGVITDKRKKKGTNVGRKKKLSVSAGLAGVSGSQTKKNIEAEMMEAPQLDGEIQDDPASLTKRKSQEERFDEMKQFTPRRVNLLRRFTKISAKPEEGSQDQASSSSSSTEPFLDSPGAGKVCQTCKARVKKLRSCSVCSAVVYCGRDCQRKDWSNHQKDCWVIPGAGYRSAYRPKKRLQSVEVQEDLGAPDQAKTPEKGESSSTPDNSPTLIRSIRTAGSQAPKSKRKLRTDVDPLVASAGIRRKISFRDDLDDEVHEEADVSANGSDEKAGAGAGGQRGLRL